MKILQKRATVFLLTVFLLSDLGYSFFQYYLLPLDGDLPSIVLPSQAYQKVMNDPFGLNVILNKEMYAAPNRYFAHFSLYGYFNSVPFLLQKFVPPIKSIYLSCALLKLGIHILLIYILSLYVSYTSSTRGEQLLAAVLLSPLFLATGENNRTMGIIDESVVYAFFYALPLALLLIFLFPFYRSFLLQEPLKLSIWQKIGLGLLMIILCFNGPLIPGVVLVGFPIILLAYYFKTYNANGQLLLSLKKLDRSFVVLFVLFIFLSLYSLFIGSYNSENSLGKLDLLSRFERIPKGLYTTFLTRKEALVLVIAISVNLIVLWRTELLKNNDRLKRLLGFLALFLVLYIILLPFGGFRYYRPNILRNDTLAPVFLILFFVFGFSSLMVLTTSVVGKTKKWYLFFIGGIWAFYLVLDTPLESKNWSERVALKTISESSLHVVPIKDSCTVLSWELVSDSLDSRVSGKMLKRWRVTRDEKLYFHAITTKAVSAKH